jgi:hypothetical protein
VTELPDFDLKALRHGPGALEGIAAAPPAVAAGAFRRDQGGVVELVDDDEVAGLVGARVLEDDRVRVLRVAGRDVDGIRVEVGARHDEEVVVEVLDDLGLARARPADDDALPDVQGRVDPIGPRGEIDDLAGGAEVDGRLERGGVVGDAVASGPKGRPGDGLRHVAEDGRPVRDALDPVRPDAGRRPDDQAVFPGQVGERGPVIAAIAVVAALRQGAADGQEQDSQDASGVGESSQAVSHRVLLGPLDRPARQPRHYNIRDRGQSPAAADPGGEEG